MKKLFPILLMLVATVFTACSSDDDNTFKVSFESANYTLTKGSVQINITAANAPATATDIPVTFGGTAVKGDDYTVSAEKYTVGGNSAVTSITVTAKNNFTEAKTITMSLSGAETGANPTTTINLGVQDKRLYSFAQKAYVLGNEVEVEFDLLNIKDGSTYTAENDIEVSAYADPLLSTAVEGTNYEFVNKTAVIKKGESKCTFKLKALSLEAGKNVIVVTPQVTEAEGFVAGAFPTATVTMIGSYASDLLGTWVMNKMVTTKENFISTWACTEKDAEGWPVLNADDTFTFSGDGAAEGYKLTTSLKSELKNYFNETSDFSIDKECTLRVGMGEKRTTQLLKLNNVNRYFSATKQSEDKVAYVAVRNITDEAGETLLDVYVVDYNSKSFAYPLFEDYGMYDTAKPTAWMDGMFINFTLKKKQ